MSRPPEAVATDDEIPHNRLHLTLDLDADNLDEIYHALRNLAVQLEHDRREEREITSGGYGSSYYLKLTCDPEQTGDRYREQLAQWSARRRKERAS